MLGRVVHSDDFKRLLGAPIRARSAHFAVHYVAGAPRRLGSTQPGPESDELSTAPLNNQAGLVDNLLVRHWIGTVLPKRHARRAVTRNLLRRQIRGAMRIHSDQLPAGTWLVRLRSPFSRADFASAASAALCRAARAELNAMLAHAAR